MRKAARDLQVGDRLISGAVVTKLDTTTWPGTVFVWLSGNDEPAADLMLSHGDPIKIKQN